MVKTYEYMVLTLKKVEGRGWIIEYLEEIYPRDIYMVAMLDYLGLDGWKLLSSTHGKNNDDQEEERLYFQRDYDRVSQPPKLQTLINEIDNKSNTHFAETSLLGVENSQEDANILKQKVLEHLYDWLSKHTFVWGEPGTGVLESHYLNKMEDVTDDPFFPNYHGINKVSTRIDIFKESKKLRIAIKRRISGNWSEYSKYEFPYSQEGLKAIQTILSMQHFRLISN
ncbi:MAG: hypothetical protein PF439_10655 [Helicobacteraceae bacterium]|jgi:hypothetical protein|nr:hypothetical protein [Helicobacteraceae bacterium]